MLIYLPCSGGTANADPSVPCNEETDTWLWNDPNLGWLQCIYIPNMGWTWYHKSPPFPPPCNLSNDGAVWRPGELAWRCNGATGMWRWIRRSTDGAVPGNFVGILKLKGNRYDSATVTATGSQQYDEVSEERTQTVDSAFARADHTPGSAMSSVSIWTGPRPSLGWRLAPGVYRVFFLDYGDSGVYAYTMHRVWNSHGAQNIVAWELGSVTVDGIGNISAATGTMFQSFSAGWATFVLPFAAATTPPR